MLCSYLSQSRDEEVAAQGSEECSPTAAPGGGCIPALARGAGQGWVTRARPVACRSHGCYSGSMAVAGSYGDRMEVMCPDHIIGVD